MSAFEDQLGAKLAEPAVPADEAFSAALSARVRDHERLRGLATQASYGACALAGAGIVYAAEDGLRWLFPQVELAVTATATAPDVLSAVAIVAMVALGLVAATVSYLRTHD